MGDKVAMDALDLEYNKQDKQDIIIAILNRQTQQLDKLEEVADKFHKSMPRDNPKKHRHYHELVIKREKEKAAFRKSIIEKSIAGLVWAALVFVGSSIWFYLQSVAQAVVQHKF